MSCHIQDEINREIKRQPNHLVQFTTLRSGNFLAAVGSAINPLETTV